MKPLDAPSVWSSPLDLDKKESDGRAPPRTIETQTDTDGDTYLQGIALIFMVLSVRLQIVDIDSGQTRQQQFQLLFVEDGDETFGDDVVETFQEAVQLFSDGPRHLHLTHQFHVFFLVLLRHGDVTAVGDKVARFIHAELLNLARKKANEQMRNGLKVGNIGKKCLFLLVKFRRYRKRKEKRK